MKPNITDILLITIAVLCGIGCLYIAHASNPPKKHEFGTGYHERNIRYLRGGYQFGRVE